MSAAPAKKRVESVPKKRSADRTPEHGPIDLEYTLAALPSAQHRAGLAGLVMTVDWLARHRDGAEGACAITHRSAGSATLRIDLPGLKRLLDAVYDASQEETASQSPWKDKQPLRVEERDVPDAKDPTKKKKKKFYIYPVVVPRGGLLVDCEPPTPDRSAPWLKLWRDMVWETLRGVPAQRGPFEARAAGAPTTDHADIWAQLTDPKDRSVKLPSTYYIGAQEYNADNVPFRDRARTQLLLHFWPFAAQIYVPSLINANEGKPEFFGYALVIPDVSDLDGFCAELPGLLQEREVDMAAYRPRAALIDLPAEGALDLARRIRDRIGAREARRLTSYYILGAEIYHLKKEGNSVRLLAASRIEPELEVVDEYARLRSLGLKDHTFRRRRLQNLLDRRPWYAGFDRIIETSPYKTVTIGSRWFCHDARISFEPHIKPRKEAMQGDKQSDAPPTLEEIVYSMVQSYVSRKMKDKYDLAWDDVKDNPKRQEDYSEKKRKLAKEAFLQIRSRKNGSDFRAYFADTIGSVKQYLPQDRFDVITSALRDEKLRDDVRILTLLALSAVG